MADFPDSAIEFAEYFEVSYFGQKLPDQCRRVPPFICIIESPLNQQGPTTQ